MTVIRMWLSIKNLRPQYMKQNLQTCTIQKWVRHGPAGMSCPVCMVAACTRVQHIMCFAGQVYTEVELLSSFMTCDSPHQCGEVGPCDEWLPLWVATQIMALTDATFLSCSSPYRSSHWIGRSTSGLRPCCCRRWFVSIVAIVASFWINEWRKNSQNKSQKWLMAQHMIYIIISSASWRSTVHDRHRISVLYSLSGAR